MYTEEEAKTKWCPMAMVQYISGSYNRHHERKSNIPPCIASSCMMWRVDEIDMLDPKESTGYCGLGGKP